MTDAAKPAVDGREVQAVRKLRQAYDLLKSEIHKVIVGQDEVIDQILIAILARGHGLVVGVPGLAKTLMVSTIARALKLSFNRLQFTPDLMPSDITGTEMIETDDAGKRHFRFVPGPVFANIVLADEINRTPPKTQAALLQAMQEHEVTVAGVTYPLAAPFFVLATQNPIEQEGTYPLPEAQLDRFMFELHVDYPAREEEEAIVERTTGDLLPKLEPVLTGEDLIRLQRLVRRVPAPKVVVEHAVRLARMTRPADPTAGAAVKEYVQWGAGPRASQYLVLGAKARAAMDGRPVPDLDDVRSVAMTVLRHRIVMNFQAEAEGVDAGRLVQHVIAKK